MYERAQDYVYWYLSDNNVETEYLSDTGTLDNLLDAGYTLEQVVSGEADQAIFSHTIWID